MTRSPSSSVLKIAASAALVLACGSSNPKAVPDAQIILGTGGSAVGTGGIGHPITGGTPATGGVETGATRGDGGAIATGGVSSPGGAPDTGGLTGTGGRSGSGGTSSTGGTSAAGGATATGGTTVGSGGTSSTGGTLVGSGGTSKTGGTIVGTGGTVGTAGAGGATASSGGKASTGGATSSGGAAGTGGISSTGGLAGTAGVTGTPVFPAIFVGNVGARDVIPADFVRYWDQFTPENVGKWASVQGNTGDTFSWSRLDAAYQYCEENNILFKEHSFIWGSSQPAWLQRADVDVPAAVQRWMKTFCDRYPKTRLIDVVNEPPPHTTPFYANDIGGGTMTTWDWIANSFKWAREACPNAVLILNDYNNVELASDAQRTIAIVNAIQKLDAPIDAVGCETHSAATLPSSKLKENIDLIASSTGLPVYITEYDINLADDAKQKAQYEDHFTMFMSNANVRGVTVWGYITGATWVSNSGIMSSDGSKRPAMTWLMDFLGR
jgi:endo-1,4-beta-xylanase